MQHYIKCGFPGIDRFLRMLSVRTYSGWEVLPQHFKRALDIWGLPSCVLRSRSKVFPSDITPSIEVLHPSIRTRELVLYIDIIYVCSESFLLLLYSPVQFMALHYLGKKTDKGTTTTAALLPPMKEDTDAMLAKGFRVGKVVSDAESSLCNLEPHLEESKVSYETIPPGRHVKQLEPLCRTLKEKMRGLLHDLPYNLALFLLKYLVKHAATLLNRQLSGVSSDLNSSPSEMVYQKKLPVHRFLDFYFGQRLYAEPITSDNSMNARGGDTIFLNIDESGILLLFNVDTNRTIHRSPNKVTPRPFDSAFIARMNKLDTKTAVKVIEMASERFALQDEELVIDDFDQDYAEDTALSHQDLEQMPVQNQGGEDEAVDFDFEEGIVDLAPELPPSRQRSHHYTHQSWSTMLCTYTPH